MFIELTAMDGNVEFVNANHIKCICKSNMPGEDQLSNGRMLQLGIIILRTITPTTKKLRKKYLIKYIMYVMKKDVS